MKKIFIFILIVFLAFPNFVYAKGDLARNARNAILIEVSSGKVIYEKNKDDRVAVASLTKMMSQILILEAVENGSLTWDEKITASANAAGYGGTQIYLEPGEIMTARELMKGISMASANDATVAMAERIAGSEEKFVEMMNRKVKELGLKNTNFVNCTGLDENNNYSSTYYLAIIVRELLKLMEIFEFSSSYEDYLRQNTPNKFWLVNTNKLVRLYDGCDGLKTGFTDKAKYSMAVTAKRNNMRLLAIVLGEDVSKVRNKETTELLDYGFNLYKINLVRKKGELIKSIKVNKGNKKKIDVILENDIMILSNKNDTSKNYKEKVILNEISLPVNINDKVGVLELYDGNELVGSYNLLSNTGINKKGFLTVLFENIHNILSGNFEI